MATGCQLSESFALEGALHARRTHQRRGGRVLVVVLVHEVVLLLVLRLRLVLSRRGDGCSRGGH